MVSFIGGYSLASASGYREATWLTNGSARGFPGSMGLVDLMADYRARFPCLWRARKRLGRLRPDLEARYELFDEVLATAKRAHVGAPPPRQSRLRGIDGRAKPRLNRC